MSNATRADATKLWLNLQPGTAPWMESRHFGSVLLPTHRMCLSKTNAAEQISCPPIAFLRLQSTHCRNHSANQLPVPRRKLSISRHIRLRPGTHNAHLGLSTSLHAGCGDASIRWYACDVVAESESVSKYTRRAFEHVPL